MNGTLTMPYDGVVEEVLLDEQSVVAQGAQVLTIQGKGAMELEISVPAEIISQVQVGNAAEVLVKSITEELIGAVVGKISPQASGNGTYLVSLDLVDAPKETRGGMDAEAQMSFENPRGNVVHVDSAAIIGSSDQSSFVWVVTNVSGNEGEVEKRSVETGNLSGDGEIEILKGQLKPGEAVVIRGANRLSEGQKVTLLEKK